MSSAHPTLPAVPAAAPKIADAYPKQALALQPASKLPPPTASRPEALERHHAAPASPSTALSPQALSSTDVSYVKSLMGELPAQKMEEILLKTGIPIPANLGPNIDTTA